MLSDALRLKTETLIVRVCLEFSDPIFKSNLCSKAGVEILGDLGEDLVRRVAAIVRVGDWFALVPGFTCRDVDRELA